MGGGGAGVLARVDLGGQPVGAARFQGDVARAQVRVQAAPEPGEGDHHAVGMPVRGGLVAGTVVVLEHADPFVLEDDLVLVRVGADRVGGTKQAILARILDVTIAGDADPAVRQLLLEDDRRRYLTQQALVDLTIGAGSLRPGCDRDQAAATFFALVNSHGYQVLATGLGWSPDDWQRWLTGVLDRELFGPG